MAGIERFEDVKAWQEARTLVTKIYGLTDEASPFKRDYGLRDQIRKASVSIMSNIAEGFGKRTDKDFSRFLYIALGSVSEVQSQLYVALDMKYISEREFAQCYDKASDTARLLLGFIKYLSGSTTGDKRASPVEQSKVSSLRTT